MTVLPCVYEVVPARSATSGWVGRVLAPAIPLLKFKGQPPPIEFAPMAAGFGGFTAYHSPGDGRVQISSKAVIFWSARSLLLMYLHEVVHRFCFRVEALGHGPVFIGTLAVFFLRIDQATADYSAIRSLSLYDLQDCPPELAGWACPQWCAEVMRFALECAAQLAGTDTAAEDVPARVLALWEVRKVELQEAVAMKAHVELDSDEQVATGEWGVLELFFSGLRGVITRYPIETLALISGCFSLSLMVWQIAAILH